MENGLAPPLSFRRKHFVCSELSQEWSCRMDRGEGSGRAQQKHRLCALAGRFQARLGPHWKRFLRREWLSFSHTPEEEEEEAVSNASKPALGLTAPAQRTLQACARSGKPPTGARTLNPSVNWTPELRVGKLNETLQWLLCCGNFPFPCLMPESTLGLLMLAELLSSPTPNFWEIKRMQDI